MEKEEIDKFIICCLITLNKSIYNPIKKLKLSSFSYMTKRVIGKLRRRDVQFSAHREIFSKKALISQLRVLDLKEKSKYPLRAMNSAFFGWPYENNGWNKNMRFTGTTWKRYSIRKLNAKVFMWNYRWNGFSEKSKYSGLTFFYITEQIFKTAMPCCHD